MIPLLKIDSIKLPPGHPPEALTAEAARILRVRPEAVRSIEPLRRSIDARDGVVWSYAVAVSLEDEAAALRRCRRGVSRIVPP